jgi:putative endopeptidase
MNKLTHFLAFCAVLFGAQVIFAAANDSSNSLPDPGFSVDKMDRSVRPGDDFAKFAAGGWYRRAEIPAGRL